MGTQPVATDFPDDGGGVAEFCRHIETHLCRKNDGHLIRVVGPSFAMVSGWAERGIPLKVAIEGIDRYFERYYRAGPRRRPVKIDFCEADVLDVFDEWRRATGIRVPSAGPPERGAAGRHSLPEHLERVVTRLTSARASGALGGEADAMIDRAAAALEAARAKAGGLRGAARADLIARLADIDRELVAAARVRMDERTLAEVAREAEEELAPFRAGMTADAYGRALDAAAARLVRARRNLPVVAFD